jgi:hypothetical protein
MKKGKLPPFAFDAGSIFIHRKPAAAAAAAATTTTSKVPPRPLLCPLAFPLRQERVFPSSFGPHVSETLLSPQVLMLPLSGVTFLRHNAQAASTAKENTLANALLHVCPHTAYCSICVRIPGKHGQGKQTRKRCGKRCCCCPCCCGGSCSYGATGPRQSLSRGGRLFHQSCARRYLLLPL